MADKKGVLTMTGDVTAAQSTLFQRAYRGALQRQAGRQRKRRASSSSARSSRKSSGRAKSRSSGATKGRLKKGSPAAKRRMAALRRMQKR